MQKVLTNISKYRSALMGIAMIWIIFAHSYVSINLPLFIKFPFMGLGFGGVEIFLFLSGFGIYYSLNKNIDLGKFFLKRIYRFLPAVPIFIVYFILMKITVFHTIVGYFTLENFWLDKRHFGFLSYAFLCYTLSPIFFDITNKHLQSVKNQLLFLLFIFILTIPFWGDGRIQGVARLPIFLIGFYCGYYYVNKKDNIKYFLYKAQFVSIFAFLALVIIYLFLYEYRIKYGLIYYGMCFFVPGFIFTLTFVLDKLKFVTSILSFVGKNSLEIFLIDSLVTTFWRYDLLFYQHLMLSILGGILYSLIINKITEIVTILSDKRITNYESKYNER